MLMMTFHLNINDQYQAKSDDQLLQIQMDGLNCKFCHRLSHQFTILRCDHVVCAECLWSQLKASLAGTNSIRCPCGQISNFTSKSIIATPSATANISSSSSPRRFSSAQRPLRTETMALSRRKDDTPLKSRRRSNEPKNQQRKDELGRELDFLGIQFRKSLEQVQRNFKLVVQTLQKRYQNLVANIRLFWLQQIVQSEPLQILNVSKLLQRKYHKAVGHKIKHLNDTLLQNLSTYRMNTLQFDKFEMTSVGQGKQNRSRVQNCRLERQRLLRNIEQMKQEGRGLRKMGRKAPKIKFI